MDEKTQTPDISGREGQATPRLDLEMCLYPFQVYTTWYKDIQ